MPSLDQSKPWIAQGISRATWFRRQKEKGAPDGRLRQAKPRALREPVIDASIPRNALSKASEAEQATDRAKVAAMGPSEPARPPAPHSSPLASRPNPPTPRRAEPRGHEMAVYKPLPTTSSMAAGRMVKPAPKHAQGMAASGGTPPGPPLNIEITPWQLGHLLQTRRADQAEIEAWKDRAGKAERRNKELEREKSAKAASQAKWWAEAQRLWFKMLRPQSL